MSVVSKILRAGEGKKVRRLAELVPLVNDLDSAMSNFRLRLLNSKSVWLMVKRLMTS